MIRNHITQSCCNETVPPDLPITTRMAFFLLVLALASHVAAQSKNYEVLYEWKQVDYNFPNDSARNSLLLNGGFVPVNCPATGLKIFRDVAFVATPRYRNGVPSTLNVIPYRRSPLDMILKGKEGPKFTPFPSWEMQEEGNCKALQTVQAMELDPYNRLWIVDVGRTELLMPVTKNLCPAKLVIYDLNSNKIERVHEFPNEVVPRDSNIIKDIQVACTTRQDCHAYVSNLNGTNSIVVYQYKNDDSWYAAHPSMQPDMTKALVTINGVAAMTPFGITGLGLTPKSTKYSTVYFSKIAGDHIYAVPTSILKDAVTLKKNPNLPDSAVRDLGVKPMGQADGTAMDNRGRWYFGSLPEDAVYSIDTNDNSAQQISRASRIVQDDNEMQWPDTFSYDGLGNLAFTTTKFQMYANMLVDPLDVNYRLVRTRTDSLPYSA